MTCGLRSRLRHAASCYAVYEASCITRHHELHQHRYRYRPWRRQLQRRGG